jgi:hypothetical protein
LLGDLLRADQELAKATTEYQEALAIEPANAAAQTGLRAIETQQSPLLKLAYYTFEDTVDLQQSGIYSYFSAPITDRLRAFIFANELFFKQPPNETSERFETGFGFNYTINSALQIAAGASRFKTEKPRRRVRRQCRSLLQTFLDAGRLDFLSLRRARQRQLLHGERVLHAGYLLGRTQLPPASLVMASPQREHLRLLDGNTRTSFLASLAYYLRVKTAPVLKLEYEYLNFSDQTPLYSSPDNYTRFRPVLEWTPELTSWLKLECHGELTYVFDEADGVTALSSVRGFIAAMIWNSDSPTSIIDSRRPDLLSGSGFKVDFCIASDRRTQSAPLKAELGECNEWGMLASSLWKNLPSPPTSRPSVAGAMAFAPCSRSMTCPTPKRNIIQNPAFRWEMEQKSGQPLSPCVEVNDTMLPDISGERTRSLDVAERDSNAEQTCKRTCR